MVLDRASLTSFATSETGDSGEIGKEEECEKGLNVLKVTDRTATRNERADRGGGFPVGTEAAEPDGSLEMSTGSHACRRRVT